MPYMSYSNWLTRKIQQYSALDWRIMSYQLIKVIHSYLIIMINYKTKYVLQACHEYNITPIRAELWIWNNILTVSSWRTVSSQTECSRRTRPNLVGWEGHLPKPTDCVAEGWIIYIHHCGLTVQAFSTSWLIPLFGLQITLCAPAHAYAGVHKLLR